MLKKISIIVLLVFFVLLAGCLDDDGGKNEDASKDTQSSPVANFTIKPVIPMVNEKIKITSNSFHPNGTIVNWTWEMGDGTTLYDSVVDYSYNNPGVYNISLIILDDDNNSDSIKKQILVIARSLLNNISLRIEDLPEGYEKYLESYNSTFGFNFSSSVSEIYNEQFIYGDPLNNTGFPVIITTLIRFNSSELAEEVLSDSIKMMNDTFNMILPCVSTEVLYQIGDQSFYRLFQGELTEQYNYENATWSFLYFRVHNITVLVLLDEVPTSSVDYRQLTHQYAKTIYARIDQQLYQ